MKLKIFIYSVLLAVLFSCQSNENKIEFERKIEADFKRTFQELGVKIRDTAFIDKDVLNVSIIQDSGYYVDYTTNHLLRSYFLFKYYDELKEMSSINITVEFKGMSDVNTFYYTRKGIEKIYSTLDDNPLFLKLVPYITRNTDANDIIDMDYIINELPDIVPQERYEYSGNGFWEFVYDYTKSCCNENSMMHNNMDEAYYLSKYPDFPFRPDIFEYIINMCIKYCKENG